MAKKPNYGFEKRKRENDRRAKQDQKLQKKREASQARGETPGGEAPATGLDPSSETPAALSPEAPKTE